MEQRAITTLRAMGQNLAWTLLQQARGIPEAKGMDDFLEDKTFVLLFARHDLSERLCVTAAIRQMSGHTVYMGPEDSWEEAISQFPTALLGSISYYMDGVVTHGLSLARVNPGPEVDFPILNCGGKDSHPAHALADIACIMRHCGDDLREVNLAWVGVPSGTLFSLIDATTYFPFTLRVAVPQVVPSGPVEAYASAYGNNVTFYETTAEAVKGCQFVMAGNSGKGLLTFDEIGQWKLTAEDMSHALPGAKVLIGTNPMSCITVDPDVLSSKTSLLLMQAEYRLRVYKRMLHWLYEL